jgi:pimeloyl-ACP methyl ester carboxylesterase
MPGIYKSAAGELAVRERYIELLSRWPVPSQQLRIATRQGETFIVACGHEDALPLLLFHGSAANSAIWMGDVAAWAEHFRIYAVDMIGEPGLSAPSRPPLASEAHMLWLDDVMQTLALSRASIIGVSLGGWLALDYATRRPDRVESVVVLCPGGIGRQKIGILFKMIPLRMLGHWGTRKLREMILGRAPANASPAIERFTGFISLIHENFRPRMVKMPVFSDAALQRLTMPVMAIVGGRDVLLDSAETRRRLDRNAAHAEIRYLPEAGHFIPGQTAPILEFLLHAGVRVYECPREGPQPRTDRDAVDLISEAWQHRATLLAIPAERLGDDFFDLKTRIAGEILQKFVNYRLRVAIVGDISRYVTESRALRDFVYESNRGRHVWFVASLDEIRERLRPR